jgi:glucose-specific phosphotransferase system IIA component
MRVDYLSPILGKHMDVSHAPDDTFQAYMLGVGFVIFPDDNKIYSPTDGVVSLIFPTKHAIAVKHASGIQILIHLGFGTVDLKGEGITLHVELHQHVKQGDLLLSFDFDFLSKNALSLATPVVFLQNKHLTILKEEIINQKLYMQLEIS